MSRSVRGLILGLALLVWVGLGVINIHWSDLNQDEGWYLYAARSVTQGQAPFQDFAFTQGPVFPYIYALAYPVVSAKGVVAGRWITFFLSGLTLLGVYRLAGRHGGAQAALFAVILLGMNVYQSQFTTTVKTYALAGALLVWGLILVQRALDTRSTPWIGLMGGLLLALAAGTRLSAGLAIPIACMALLAQAVRGNSWAWLWTGIGSAVGLIILFGPFLWMAPEAVRFGLLDYHAGRASGDLATMAIFKAGFISRMVQSYFVASVVLVAVVAGRVLMGRMVERETEPGKLWPGAVMLWWIAAAISLVHFLAPFPYDDYQVMVYPVVCAALGISLSHWIGDEPARVRWVTAVLILASLAAAFSSPVNQAWVLRGRDRIWWRLKDASPMVTLQETGEKIREQTDPDDLLLTQDTYLAVEADRSVPHGLEMGPFSYYPELDGTTATARGVTNRDMLLQIIRTTAAPIAAVSGYGFAIASPGVEELDADHRGELLAALAERYELDQAVEYFGQAQTRLEIFRRKSGSAGDSEGGPRPPGVDGDGRGTDWTARPTGGGVVEP